MRYVFLLIGLITLVGCDKPKPKPVYSTSTAVGYIKTIGEMDGKTYVSFSANPMTKFTNIKTREFEYIGNEKLSTSMIGKRVLYTEQFCMYCSKYVEVKITEIKR